MAILRCTTPFAARDSVNAVAPRVIAGGELIDSTDPIVKGHEHLFEEVETYVSRRSQVEQVEQATAAPGEARTVSTAKRTGRKAS